MKKDMKKTLIWDRTVAKIDGYQEYENNIIILDFVMTQTPGFLNEINCLIVVLSRARDGLYILGNKEAWDGFRKKNAKRHLFKMLSKIVAYHQSIDDTVICPYLEPEQVDLRGITDHEDDVAETQADSEEMFPTQEDGRQGIW